MNEITPSEAAAALGRLSKGKTSARKKATSRANWKKAEAVLRKTRWLKTDAVAGPAGKEAVEAVKDK